MGVEWGWMGWVGVRGGCERGWLREFERGVTGAWLARTALR